MTRATENINHVAVLQSLQEKPSCLLAPADFNFRNACCHRRTTNNTLLPLQAVLIEAGKSHTAEEVLQESEMNPKNDLIHNAAAYLGYKV